MRTILNTGSLAGNFVLRHYSNKTEFRSEDPLLAEEIGKLLPDNTNAHPDVFAADELAALAILNKRFSDNPRNWRGILRGKINGKTPLLDCGLFITNTAKHFCHISVC